MAQIQLPEHFFQEAKRRAAGAGFATVDAYIAYMLSQELLQDGDDETPNLDHLFTPERMARIEAGDAEIQAGNCFTAEQVREHFKQKRAEWNQKNGPR